MAADRDPEVRAIVVTGAGRAFCAGLDLRPSRVGGGLGASGASPGEFELRDAPPIVLHNVDTPTICALNGGAAGYGMDLALGCDIRVAGESGKLAPASPSAASCPRAAARGCCPASSATPRRPRSPSPAARCRPRSASISASSTAWCADAELPTAAQRAGRWRSPPTRPLAVRATKRMMRMAESETFEQNVHHVFLQLLPLFRSEDFKEGMAAFLEKRAPNFTGR